MVVVGAGKPGQDDGHIAAEVSAGRPAAVSWVLNPTARAQTKLEIWYRASEPLDIALEAPDGRATLIDVAPGPTRPLRLGNRIVGIADHTLAARGALSCVRVVIHPPLLAGLCEPQRSGETAAAELTWTVRLAARSAGYRAKVHAWLERDTTGDAPA